MTRSLLRPLRTRRLAHSSTFAPVLSVRAEFEPRSSTRKTVAAIGALLVAFAASSSATPVATDRFTRGPQLGEDSLAK
jgi:hypothetical protein